MGIGHIGTYTEGNTWVGISDSQGELKMKVVLEMQLITIIVKCSHKHDTRALVSTRSTLPLCSS